MARTIRQFGKVRPAPFAEDPAVQTVRCPTCNKPPGTRCWTIKSHSEVGYQFPTAATHKSRNRLYEARRVDNHATLPKT